MVGVYEALQALGHHATNGNPSATPVQLHAETANNVVLKPIDISPPEERQNMHPRFWCGQHSASPENGVQKDVYNYAVDAEEKEKTPMCQIAQLARFHKLKHEYKLMDESGPAHKKLFTVQLVLTPTEIYEGSGASIKKAQQSAAMVALRESSLPRPPQKSTKKQKKADPSNTCILLAHVCRRLKMAEPTYQVAHMYVSMRSAISNNMQAPFGLPHHPAAVSVPPPPAPPSSAPVSSPDNKSDE